VEIERAQRARIIEHDARAIIENDRRARETRKRVVRAIEMPIARHAEMSVKHASIVERQQLMLAATFDGPDRGSAK